jgi:hypothetical protein
MQLLDDASDDDEDSFEVESEDESDDDEGGDTQNHPVNEILDAELSSDEEESQPDVDESPESGFAFSNGHQTIKRLQDDLLADEDELDDGMFYFQCRALNMLMPSCQVCRHMRGAFPSFNNKSRPWRPKILAKKTGH